jgi:uncharacterized surface protein with fasciclin (FAS1) repeats
MNHPSRFLLAFAAGALTLTAPIAAQAHGPLPATVVVLQEGRDLENIVRDRKDLSMFKALTETFGVIEPLRSPGTNNKGYTIFVPSDNAFAKLPAAAVEELRQNRDLMQQVLKYHMLAGKVPAADVTSSMTPNSLQGEPLAIRKSGSKVWVGNAVVIESDQMGSNGVIHIIDQVLLPPTVRDNLTRRAILPLNDAKAQVLGQRQNAANTRTVVDSDGLATNNSSGRPVRMTNAAPAANLVELAVSSPNLSTFHRLATEAGIANSLMEGSHTIFAPTDDAFASLPSMVTEALVADKELLKQVLLFHTVNGEITASELRRGGIRAGNGDSLYIKVGPKGAAKVNDAIVLDKDLMARNGAIHTINKVLLPTSVANALRAKGISIGN